MKTLIIILTGVIICYLFQTFIPIWWIFSIVTLIIGLVGKFPSGWRTFFTTWIIVFITWILLYLIKDVANDSIMSAKMATLFSMKSNFWLFGIVSGVMGLVGGLTAVAGYYITKKETV